jgi:DnaJ-domain-containing protein 1
MQDLKQKVKQADNAFKRNDFKTAVLLYREAFDLCTKAAESALDTQRIGQGVGWIAALLTGGVGLEDLFIIPAVSNFVSSLLGVSVEELDRISRTVAANELVALTNCPDLLRDTSDVHLLKRFALLYSSLNTKNSLNSLIDLYALLPSRQQAQIEDRYVLMQKILHQIPQMSFVSPNLNQLLLIIGSQRDWPAIVRVLGKCGYKLNSRTVASTSMQLSQAYQILGIPHGSSPEVVKTAYRTKISQWHPDKHVMMSAQVQKQATEQTQKVNAAYELIQASFVKS